MVQLLRNAVLYRPPDGGPTLAACVRLKLFNLVNIFDRSDNGIEFGAEFENLRSEDPKIRLVCLLTDLARCMPN